MNDYLKTNSRYGRGRSTGIEQTVTGTTNLQIGADDIAVSAADRIVLQRLAHRVAELASTDEQLALPGKWQRHNDLISNEPLIFCDPENGWNEIITDAEMECTGELARIWEMSLRKEIFWAEEMGDDKPVGLDFNIPFLYAPDNWGIVTEMLHTDDSNGAYAWKPPIEEYDDNIDKVCYQGVEYNRELTERCYAEACEIFNGILNVRKKASWWWTLGLTMTAVFMRGIENLMFDFFDEPDGVHELMKRIADGQHKRLDFLEKNGLLTSNAENSYVGSGGFGFTDQLPHGKETITCADIWGFAESQETSGVSAEMYGEFIFPYEKPILDRFGLNCYGCCEPIDRRWNYVKQHHNLRRVSCSPWSDYEVMADHLKSDYIFSMKVNPSPIAVASPDFDEIRKELRKNLEVTKGCIVEVIMKDNHTLGGNYNNAVEWCRIAREEIARVY